MPPLDDIEIAVKLALIDRKLTDFGGKLDDLIKVHNELTSNGQCPVAGTISTGVSKKTCGLIGGLMTVIGIAAEKFISKYF